MLRHLGEGLPGAVRPVLVTAQARYGRRRRSFAPAGSSVVRAFRRRRLAVYSPTPCARAPSRWRPTSGAAGLPLPGLGAQPGQAPFEHSALLMVAVPGRSWRNFRHGQLFIPVDPGNGRLHAGIVPAEPETRHPVLPWSGAAPVGRAVEDFTDAAATALAAMAPPSRWQQDGTDRLDNHDSWRDLCGTPSIDPAPPSFSAPHPTPILLDAGGAVKPGPTGHRLRRLRA